MATLATTFLGMEMQSPFIVGSSPLSFDASAMIAAHKAGAGAVVTKTIRDKAAINPVPHIWADSSSMINSELWSDLSGDAWVGREIPLARLLGVNVIASIGHTPEEAGRWVPLVEQAGAQAIELVSYDQTSMVSMVRTASSLTALPILVKLSPNWSDPLGQTDLYASLGAHGFTVMDSLGPALRIDIRTGRSVVGGNERGWLTGSPLKAIALHYVASLAARSSAPIIGLGGISTASDVIEMSMAGASAVGLCTSLMVKGIASLSKLIRETSVLLDSLGYQTLGETRNLFNTLPVSSLGAPSFVLDRQLCTDCGRCRQVCSYVAQHTQYKVLSVDTSLCRYCGLCISACPTHALFFSYTGEQGNA
ncbi:MAG: 4Fe-4S binding protein [Sphaerochaeta sp.]|nr:4Fe-4S binding protein [Sphaerochaeta sp.]